MLNPSHPTLCQLAPVAKLLGNDSWQQTETMVAPCVAWEVLYMRRILSSAQKREAISLASVQNLLGGLLKKRKVF